MKLSNTESIYVKGKEDGAEDGRSKRSVKPTKWGCIWLIYIEIRMILPANNKFAQKDLSYSLFSHEKHN